MKRGWEEITFDNKKPNQFRSCGANCIEIETDASVSLISQPMHKNLSLFPFMTWEWKVDEPVQISDLTTKGKDDRAAAIYVTFAYDPANASLTERSLRPMIEMIRGSDTPSRVLSYVWSGFGQPDEMIQSPFFGGVNVMIIKRNEVAPNNQWLKEKVNVFKDHQRAFGRKPSEVIQILISADSDDTKTSNKVLVRNISFAVK